MKPVFTDHLILPFLVRQVSNEIELSWDISQIDWHQCRDKTEKIQKKLYV